MRKTLQIAGLQSGDDVLIIEITKDNKKATIKIPIKVK